MSLTWSLFVVPVFQSTKRVANMFHVSTQHDTGRSAAAPIGCVSAKCQYWWRPLVIPFVLFSPGFVVRSRKALNR